MSDDTMKALNEIEGMLISANEYWNGSRTDGAMSDALCFIETKVANALSLLPTLRAALTPPVDADTEELRIDPRQFIKARAAHKDTQDE